MTVGERLHAPVVRRWILPFLCATGILFGPAYVAYQHFDRFDPRGLTDAAHSYLPMAAGRLDEGETLHTYRVVVPVAAGSIGRAIDAATGVPWGTPRSLKHVRIGFLLVNLSLVSLAATLAFRLARAHRVSLAGAAAAAIVLLTSRHAVYLAGTPMVDSLYLVAIGMMFYAIRIRHLGLLSLAILAGLLAKESFVLFLPIALWYGPSTWGRRAASATAALAIVVVFRALVEPYVAVDQGTNLMRAASHLGRTSSSLGNLMRPESWIKLALVFNLFTVVPVAAAIASRSARRSLGAIDAALWLVLPVVLAHMLLSGNIERMALLSFPLFCIASGLVFDVAWEVVRGSDDLDRSLPATTLEDRGPGNPEEGRQP